MEYVLQNFILDIPNALLISALVINITLFAIMFQSREWVLGSNIYFINILIILLWIVAMLWYRNIADPELITFATTVLYAIPTFIASTFLYFCFNYPHATDSDRRLRAGSIFGLNAAVLIMVFWPEAVIDTVTLVPGGDTTVGFGDLYPLYVLYLVVYFTLGIGILTARFFLSKDIGLRQQLFYLAVGYIIAFFFTLLTNVMMPWVGNFSLDWLGQVLSVLVVAPLVYAAYRQTLIDQRIVVTEILVGTLIVFILIRALIPQTDGERVLNVIIFFVITSIGLYLIKTVRNEAVIQHKNEELIADLSAANQRLRRLDQKKSQFISIASHQLRSPLTAIQGYSSMLVQGSYGTIPAKLVEPLRRIERSARVMAGSIGDYLDISQIEAGDMKYVCEKFDLHIAATHVCDNLQNEAAKKNTVLSCASNMFGPTMVYADKTKTEQIIYNLVSNAIQYTENGSVAVQLYQHGEQDRIYLSVTDTGIGIDTATQQAIFQKFERSKEANVANVHGTGLGLYVAKRMALKMGGDISAYSDGVGKGSQFILYLPRS